MRAIFLRRRTRRETSWAQVGQFRESSLRAIFLCPTPCDRRHADSWVGAFRRRTFALLSATKSAESALDGPVICRMFNRAIAKQTPPKYLSSDNDPLFRFHRWCANPRILEVDEIKTIPCTPLSHPFVERLIGTVRPEYLDRTFFWNRGDLERKLDNYQAYYNQHRCHTGLAGATPAKRSGGPTQPSAKLESYTWRQHCHGLFQTPTLA